MAMIMKAKLITDEDSVEWDDARRFDLGRPPGSTARAVASVGVREGLNLAWRIDLFAPVGQSCFQDIRCIGDRVYIGYGQQVAVFSPYTEHLQSHSLAGYFGHLFTATDLESVDLGSSVLVASASELLRFDGEGQFLWRRSELGIDGVIVQRVLAGEILGDAEWDPPGGWKPFRLSLETGADSAN